MSDNSTTFNEEVRQHIRVGSSVQKVKSLLERSEFECSDSRSFGLTEGSEQKRSSPNKGYLLCLHSAAWVYQEQTHTIKVYFEGEKVTGVNASFEQTSS